MRGRERADYGILELWNPRTLKFWDFGILNTPARRHIIFGVSDSDSPMAPMPRLREKCVKVAREVHRGGEGC